MTRRLLAAVQSFLAKQDKCFGWSADGEDSPCRRRGGRESTVLPVYCVALGQDYSDKPELCEQCADWLKEKAPESVCVWRAEDFAQRRELLAAVAEAEAEADAELAP